MSVELKTCPVCKAQVPAKLNETDQLWYLVTHYVTSGIVIWTCPGEGQPVM